jgi:exodeoxyribonuclease V gamma subunit
MAIDPGIRAQRALRVVRSTTAASLCDELAQRVSRRWAGDMDGLPRIGPFDRVVVAVQGKGLERWLRRALAQRLGVVGGIDTPYLRRFLLDVASVVNGIAPPSRDRDDVLELSYRIAQEISERCAAAGDLGAHKVQRVDGAHVRPLVTEGDAGKVHPHALLSAGHRMAGIFDALELERPELVMAWRAGHAMPARAPWLQRDAPDFGRLAALCEWMHRLWWWTAGPRDGTDAATGCWSGHRAWQSVRDAIGVLSSDTKWRESQARLVSGQAADACATLPAMVSVFGISSLPPLVMEFLAALGTRMDVTLHLVVPTEQYMDHSIMGRPGIAEPDEGHLDSLWSRGHRLLATCGRQAMAMQQRLLSLGAVEEVDCVAADAHVRTGTVSGDGVAGAAQPSALQALQRSLREGEMLDRGAGADGSISVHLVSGATRAAEVLRDQVLDAFASMPGTGPDDVLVLTTDVERYGTAIARALGSTDPRPIPVTIADRSMRVEREGVRAFCEALRALDGDLTVDAIGEIVSAGPVAERAGVSPEEALACVERLHGVGGRRFIDADHRCQVLASVGGSDSAVQHAAPGTAPDGTIDDAADRLAMAAAMGTGIGGTELPGLARICALVDAMLELARGTSADRTMAEWCAWSRSLIDTILPRRTGWSDDADLAGQRAALADAVESVASAASRAGLAHPLPFTVARSEIIAALDRSSVGRRFGGTGGVTVGGLVPMRSVPSRIVALVGLDRGSFPRRDERSGLDPRRWSHGSGDRSARDEDRALFLEAIHSAGDRLIVISTAVDAASGEPEPPSPIVELLVEQCGSAARVTRHGVHAFGEEEWSSGDDVRPRRDAQARRCAAARRVGSGPDAVRRTLCADMGAPVRMHAPLLARVSSLDRIVECMRDPARWWLDAVGARLAAMDSDIDELEPVTLDGRARWALEQSLIEGIVRGSEVSVEAVIDAQRRMGALPAGAAADDVESRLRQWIERDVRQSAGIGACPASPHEWTVDGPGGAIDARGWRSNAEPGTLVLCRGGSWTSARSLEIAVHAAAWAAAGGTRTVVLPSPDRRSGMPSEIVWSGTAEDAAHAIHRMRAIAAAGMVVPLAFHPALIVDADVAGLRAGTAESAGAIASTLDAWLSRNVDDRSRGDVDARALRAVMQGMRARDVLGARSGTAVDPPPDAGIAARVPESGSEAVGAVRTDFQDVSAAVLDLLCACGWSGGSGGSGRRGTSPAAPRGGSRAARGSAPA